LNGSHASAKVQAVASRRKGKAARSNFAWVVSAVVIAGGVGTLAWFETRAPQKAKSQGSNALFTTNPAVKSPSQDNTNGFLAWVSNQTVAAELVNAGTELLAEGRITFAIVCYRRAVELKPEDEEAHFNLGVAFARAGQLAEAERHYREALRLFPEYAEAHNNLGNVLTRLKRYGDAIEEFNAAIKLTPENALAHNNLGRVFAEQGDAQNAITHFAEAARLDTNYAEARFNLGAAYLTAGRTNEAVTEFNATLRIRPDFAPALQMLSRIRGVGR
jgi:tetratricopeptide (TPR) repeat protein